LRYRAGAAPVRGARRRRLREIARPVRRCAVGRATATTLARARSLRHLSALLVGAGGSAAVRVGDQGAAGVGPCAGETRCARHQPRLHLLRVAGTGDVLCGRQLPVAWTIPEGFALGANPGTRVLADRLPRCWAGGSTRLP